MRQEKIAILNEIVERLKAADSTIVLSYGGLTVAEMQELRKAVKPLEGRCLVAKNTLVRKAAAELGWADITSMLTGSTAVVTAKGDASELAKVVCEFVKKHAKAQVKGGALDKAALGAAEVEALSKLPGKDQLRAQLLATLMAPATNLVRVFVAPLTGVLYALKAKAEKDGGAAEGAAE
ncbi:MAG: 50S ribosomal protein L10 [Kiritimatiellae bacterium]|nr:50S ribosomal protein L10 [Kiritimatiellia bacterium]